MVFKPFFNSMDEGTNYIRNSKRLRKLQDKFHKASSSTVSSPINTVVSNDDNDKRSKILDSTKKYSSIEKINNRQDRMKARISKRLSFQDHISIIDEIHNSDYTFSIESKSNGFMNDKPSSSIQKNVNQSIQNIDKQRKPSLSSPSLKNIASTNPLNGKGNSSILDCFPYYRALLSPPKESTISKECLSKILVLETEEEDWNDTDPETDIECNTNDYQISFPALTTTTTAAISTNSIDSIIIKANIPTTPFKQLSNDSFTISNPNQQAIFTYKDIVKSPSSITSPSNPNSSYVDSNHLQLSENLSISPHKIINNKLQLHEIYDTFYLYLTKNIKKEVVINKPWDAADSDDEDQYNHNSTHLSNHNNEKQVSIISEIQKYQDPICNLLFLHSEYLLNTAFQDIGNQNLLTIEKYFLIDGLKSYLKNSSQQSNEKIKSNEIKIDKLNWYQFLNEYIDIDRYMIKLIQNICHDDIRFDSNHVAIVLLYYESCCVYNKCHILAQNSIQTTPNNLFTTMFEHRLNVWKTINYVLYERKHRAKTTEHYARGNEIDVNYIGMRGYVELVTYSDKRMEDDMHHCLHTNINCTVIHSNSSQERSPYTTRDHDIHMISLLKGLLTYEIHEVLSSYQDVAGDNLDGNYSRLYKNYSNQVIPFILQSYVSILTCYTMSLGVQYEIIEQPRILSNILEVLHLLLLWLQLVDQNQNQNHTTVHISTNDKNNHLGLEIFCQDLLIALNRIWKPSLNYAQQLAILNHINLILLVYRPSFLQVESKSFLQQDIELTSTNNEISVNDNEKDKILQQITTKLTASKNISSSILVMVITKLINLIGHSHYKVSLLALSIINEPCFLMNYIFPNISNEIILSIWTMNQFQSLSIAIHRIHQHISNNNHLNNTTTNNNRIEYNSLSYLKEEEQQEILMKLINILRDNRSNHHPHWYQQIQINSMQLLDKIYYILESFD